VARKVKKGQKWLKNGQKGVPEKWGLDVFKVCAISDPNEINTLESRTVLDPSPTQDARLP
jgi:hypothetical protein